MNPTEINFSYKVRHALNETLDNLPTSTVDRLASARKIALSHKKIDAPLRVVAIQQALASNSGNFFSEPLSWIARMGLATPLIVAAIGLVTIYQTEQQQRIQETADIDADVLSDELPISAYLDHGFDAYIAKQAE